MHRSHRNRITFAGLIAALAFAGVAGCHQEGAAEKAGKAIDEAAENVQESAQDLTMDEGPLEQAGEKADDQIEKMKDAVKDAAE